MESEMKDINTGEVTSTSGRWVLLEDVINSARGPRYTFGLERNKLIYFGLHICGVAILLLLDTYLRYVFQGALVLRSFKDVLYILLLGVVLGGHTWNYLKLYGSNPGWITFESKLDDPQLPCQYCRMAPSLRSRHDFNTGQCVHKFDHFCWLLGTAIGDCNHLRFWSFCLTETFLIIWGLLLTIHSLIPCFSALQGMCWIKAPLQTATLIALAFLLWMALNVFGGLFLFHTYLAATNQTTYEVMKGESVPYLKAFYSGYNGPKRTKMLGKELFEFAGRVMKGRGPPAPFSEKEGPWNGVGANLDLFYFGNKPQTYRYRMQPPQT